MLGPEDAAGLLIEAENALGAFGVERLGEVGDEDAAVGYGRAGVSAVDGSAPLDGQAVLGKFVEDAGLVPDTEPAFAAPLGPVVGVQIQGC